ncbi:MAG TPA: hypothetical protein PLJ47_08335 [Candidatus Hydrogenedentes bacterium]|nr:hypothetical protein [Candidatus Hydrogenedentota bacterium]
MKYIGRIAAAVCLVAMALMQTACPQGLQRFTVRVVNDSEDLYMTSLSLGKLQGQNLTIVSENLLRDDVDPANETEFRVLLSLADEPNANSFAYILEDLNGFLITQDAVLSEGFADDVTYTLTITGEASGPYQVDFERVEVAKSESEEAFAS